MIRIGRNHVRAGPLLAAFIACFFDAAAVAAVLLVMRWAAQDPEQDPVYLFIKRRFGGIGGSNS